MRVHVENPISDLTGSLAEDRGWPVNDILRRLAREPSGVLVILCDQYEPMEMINQIESYKHKRPPVERNNPENSRDLRTIGLGAQILSDLGVQKMRVLSPPKRIHALSGFGLEVVEYVY